MKQNYSKELFLRKLWKQLFIYVLLFFSRHVHCALRGEKTGAYSRGRGIFRGLSLFPLKCYIKQVKPPLPWQIPVYALLLFTCLDGLRRIRWKPMFLYNLDGSLRHCSVRLTYHPYSKYKWLLKTTKTIPGRDWGPGLSTHCSLNVELFIYNKTGFNTVRLGAIQEMALSLFLSF